MSDANTIAAGAGRDGNRLRAAGLGAIVFLAALTVRLAYLAAMEPSPYYNIIFLKGTDCYTFYAWALEISSGDPVGRGIFNQSPLYPYFLALIFKSVGGGNLLAPRFFQVVLGAMVSVLAFVMGRDLKGELAGFVAGMLIALHGPMVFYEAAFLRTGVLVFLNTLLVFLMVRAQRRPGPVKGIACGLVFGLAVLAKPNIAVMAAAAPYWLWLARKNAGTRKTALMGSAVMAGFFLTMVPLGIRNREAGVPMSSMTVRGPLEFVAGNHPDMPPDQWQPTPEIVDLANRARGSLLRSVGVVLDYYRGRPLQLAAKEWTKTRAFLSGYEAPNSIDYYVEKRYVPIIRLLPVTWPVVLGLSIVGLWLCRRKFREQFPLFAYIALYSLGAIAFYVLARFRLPVVPALCVFAGAAVAEVAGMTRSGRWKSAAAAAAVAALIAMAAWPHGDDPIPPSDYQNLVRFHMLKGEPERAREWADEGLARARARVAKKGDAWARYRLARMIYLSGGPLDEVKAELTAAKKEGPPPWLKSFIRGMEARCDKRRSGEDFKPGGFRML